MLSKIVGKQVFLAGVYVTLVAFQAPPLTASDWRSKIYLEAHLFGNATTADLFAGISKASGKDVAIIMREWTTKVGRGKAQRRGRSAIDASVFVRGSRLDFRCSPLKRHPRA